MPPDTNSSHPYARLLPEVVLDAVDSCGQLTSGHLLALNSYENRVYQIGLDAGGFLVAKFYRPGRLSSEAIREEHAFALELKELEIPVVAPMADESGETLFERDGFRFALFPRVGGRFMELDEGPLAFRIGRLLGCIHAAGAQRPFQHRPRIEVEGMGRQPARFLVEQGFIPNHLAQRYRELAKALLDEVEERFAACAPKEIRLHGDFHGGNILQRGEEIAIVDTDDCRMGPAVQDIWLLLSGEPDRMLRQISELTEGYEEFHEFRSRELELIEPLRTLRMIHYAYWLALRWEDPAFPMHFPWFNTSGYWEEHLNTLDWQRERMEGSV